MSVSGQETGQATGTKDKDYNLIWLTDQCLSNALRLRTYIRGAGRDGDSELADYIRGAGRDRDSELADFFRRPQHESRKGAEQGKEHLRRRLVA